MIVSVTSTQSVGCTFVDWSINYLSGKTNFYNTDLGDIKLVNSPLTITNAHGHQKNHPKGFEQTVATLSKLTLVEPNYNFLSCYPTSLKIFEASQRLGIDSAEIFKHTDLIENYIHKDYDLLWKTLCQKTRAIYIHPSTNQTYFLSQREAGNRYDQEGVFKSIREAEEDYINVFFRESAEQFDETIWDHREFLALNLRIDNSIIRPKLDFTVPHLYIDSQELWYRGPQTLLKIFDYLDLNPDPDRWKIWEEEYFSWQSIQLKHLEFGYNYEYIAEAIVNNYYYPLPSLTIQEEAAILHLLMFKYNLNIRAWGLTCFPDNTQALHTLLEKNRHRIEQ